MKEVCLIKGTYFKKHFLDLLTRVFEALSRVHARSHPPNAVDQLGDHWTREAENSSRLEIYLLVINEPLRGFPQNEALPFRFSTVVRFVLLSLFLATGVIATLRWPWGRMSDMVAYKCRSSCVTQSSPSLFALVNSVILTRRRGTPFSAFDGILEETWCG